MANAGRKQFGAGAQGKGHGSGATTDIDRSVISENMVLSNRDKSRYAAARGHDGKGVQAEQLQDSAANRLDGKV